MNMNELKPGDRVRLFGRTLKGRNRIKEHGTEWVVLDPRLTPTPKAILVISLFDRDVRWVHFQDVDFGVQA